MQGVSEWVLVEERLKRDYPRWRYIIDKNQLETTEESEFAIKYDWFRNYEDIPKVYAVQYEYLVKGKRRQDPYGSGIYKQNSFLCHPLKLDAMVQIAFGRGGTVSIDPAKYKWKVGKGAYPKGWSREDIWNDIGIKAWIEMLATGQVQPELGNPFREIILTPDLIIRHEREIQEWIVSTRALADRIARNVAEISLLTDIELLQLLIWEHFPKNTQSCHDYYGKDCFAVRHCHELETLEDLTSAGEFIRRVPHHELEKETFEAEGLLND
jgi:hypothetical protein